MGSGGTPLWYGSRASTKRKHLRLSDNSGHLTGGKEEGKYGGVLRMENAYTYTASRRRQFSEEEEEIGVVGPMLELIFSRC